MRQTASWLLAGTALALVMGGPATAFELTILHTNDVHARLDQIRSSGASCSVEAAVEGKCVGGAARLTTKIKELAAAHPNPLVLDAGDWFQGTLYYSQLKSGGIAPVADLMGYEAMAVGNHEFDDGPSELGKFIDMVSFPVLSANFDASAEPSLAGKVLPLIVVEKAGEKIGIIGLTTPDTANIASPGPNITWMDPAEALGAQVEALEAEGVTKIVALTHLGLTPDLAIAAAVPGVDVIVGGHSHTLLSNTAEGAAGPYPLVVERADGSTVLVVQAGSLGAYLGQLTVTFDEAGNPVSWTGDTHAIAPDIEPDPVVEAKVEELRAPLQEMAERPVGEAAVSMSNACRFEECRLGNLITDALLAYAPSAEIAIQNGGGIRAGIEEGGVTLGAVIEVLPFSNTAATFGLKGEHLVAALENAVSRAANPEGGGTGRFAQVAGIRFTWNAAKPDGERIVSVEVRGADGSFAPLDPERVYNVISNNFLRGGGDEYFAFRDHAIDPYDAGANLEDVVIDYFSRYSPVDPPLQGRITRVN